MSFDQSLLIPRIDEFDSGEGPLSEYLSQLDFPMISCNVETSTNVSQYLVPYVYFEQKNIAVISVLTPETKTIASPDKVSVHLSSRYTAQAGY